MARYWQCECSWVPDQLYYTSNTSKQEMAKVTKVVCEVCKAVRSTFGGGDTITQSLMLCA